MLSKNIVHDSKVQAIKGLDSETTLSILQSSKYKKVCMFQHQSQIDQPADSSNFWNLKGITKAKPAKNADEFISILLFIGEPKKDNVRAVFPVFRVKKRSDQH